MKNLVFATNNAHKLEEIRAILGDKINILSLNDIDCHADIPETMIQDSKWKPSMAHRAFIRHAMQAERDTTRKPICANYSPNWKEKPTGKLNSALPSASSKAGKNICSKASYVELSYKNAAEPQALAMTLSSNPKATPKPLPKWETKKRTKSATVPVPYRS